MKLYKLDATGSTNQYLKQLIAKNEQDNFTVVSTEYQYSGKGQSSNIWVSEKGKNLLFSVLVKFNNLSIENSAYLNFAISIGIYNVLSTKLSNIKIKWPNDIMAEGNKICGILIENSVRGTKINHSIVGIGLNVNQVLFGGDLSNVSSLKKELGISNNRSLLLKNIVSSIKEQIIILEKRKFSELKSDYEKYLFKKGIMSSFLYKKNIFKGTIKGVSGAGLLQVEDDNNNLVEFANKEIIFISK